MTPYLPKTIELSDNQLQIGLKQMGTTQMRTEHFDQIIVAYGFRANNRFVKKNGVSILKGQMLRLIQQWRLMLQEFMP